MGSAGIKISAGSYDSRNAPDYAFVYNSDWPSLACAYDTLVTMAPSATVTFNHGLKFTPLVLGWVIVGGVNKGRIFASSGNFEYADTYAHFPQTAITLKWNNTAITLVNNDGANSYTVCVKAYNLDITAPVKYTNPKPAPAKIPYDPHYGIKITKYGQNINSVDLRNFILHSRAQSPALLAVVTGLGLSKPAYYNNPVGYVPWTFAFYDDSNGNYQGLAPGSQQSGTIFQLGSALTVSGVTGNVSGAAVGSVVSTVNTSLVVLRDPLVSANTVNVSY